MMMIDACNCVTGSKYVRLLKRDSVPTLNLPGCGGEACTISTSHELLPTEYRESTGCNSLSAVGLVTSLFHFLTILKLNCMEFVDFYIRSIGSRSL